MKKTKIIEYEKLFGSASIGRDYFFYLESLPVIFSKNRILPFNLKYLFYKIDARKYEMYLSREDINRLDDYTFNNPRLANKLLILYRRDIVKYKIFWQRDKLFSSEKYFYLSKRLMEAAGCYMVMTFPQFYKKVEKYCLKEIKRIAGKEAVEILQILTTSTGKTSLLEKDSHYLKLIEKRRKNRLNKAAVSGFSDRFYYSESSNTDNFNILTPDIVKQRIQKDAKNYLKIRKKHQESLNSIKQTVKKQKEILKKYEFSKKFKDYLFMLKTLGWLRLEIRLNLMQPAETALKLWYDKYEERLDFSLWITVSELEKLKNSRNNNYKSKLIEQINKRRCGYIWYIERGKPKFIYKSGWDKFLKIHKITNDVPAREFTGMVSFRGKDDVMRGKVCKIIQGERNLAGKINKFSKGAILVSNHTTPIFVPAMKKARAVITDEGGIMSHAAIISREFRVPCIVGTKSLIRQVKSGDKIEINFKKGIVKIT